jgi:hypothetical protein
MRGHATSKHVGSWKGRLLGATSMAAVVGCLDISVIHVEPRASDGGDASVSPVDGDVAKTDGGPAACEVCIRAPTRPGYGCGNEMAACSVDPQCSGTIECAIKIDCFALNGQGPIIDCGTPCARDAGLDVASPSLFLVLAVVTCGQDSCGSICRGEVAPPVDASAE